MRDEPSPEATSARLGVRPRGSWILPAIAAAGLAVATYLTVTKLAGGSPICGPLHGCETVDASPYSTVLGIPTAAYGVAYSVVMLVATGAWWRGGARRWLLIAYAVSLAGVLVEAYLVYLQLAVIHAVCPWCATYGVTVLAGFAATVIALRGDSRA